MIPTPQRKPCCQICHEETEWRLCLYCDGIGSFDLGGPDKAPCHMCEAKGGWYQCPNHHYHDEADIRHCI